MFLTTLIDKSPSASNGMGGSCCGVLPATSARSPAGIMGCSLQQNNPATSLGFARWLPSPALLTICLRTGPTPFCRDRTEWTGDTGFCSVFATSRVTLSKPYEFPWTSVFLSGMQRGWASLFLRFFLAINFNTGISYLLFCHLLTDSQSILPNKNSYFLQSRQSLPPLNSCTFLKSVRGKRQNPKSSQY